VPDPQGVGDAKMAGTARLLVVRGFHGSKWPQIRIDASGTRRCEVEIRAGQFRCAPPQLGDPMRVILAALSIAVLAACGPNDITPPTPTYGASGSSALAMVRSGSTAITGIALAGGRATVSWAVMSGAGGYQVVSCGATNFNTQIIRDGSRSSTVILGVIPGASYGVKVRVWHTDGSPNNAEFSACVPFVGAEWVARVDVAPQSPSLAVGGSVQLVATLRDRYGNVLTGRDIAWMTSNSTVATVTTDGLTRGVSVGTATVSAESEGQQGAAAVTVQSPGWHMVQSRSATGVALTASAYAEDLDAVFAAGMYEYAAGTLWRLDLSTDAWTQVPAGNWPIGKYRKLLYDRQRHRLVTYWDGLGQVYSIPVSGGNWTADGSAGNSEQYYEAYAFMNPVNNRLTTFAGYGYGSWKNLIWEWDAGGNRWTQIATSGAVPDPRFGSWRNAVVDQPNERVFIGERSLGATPGNYDDLWVLNLRTYQFTNRIGPSTGPAARLGSAMAYDGASHTLFRFGGVTLYGYVLTADFTSSKPDETSVAWSPMPASSVTPSARYLSGLHFDSRRRRLILVSGIDGSAWWASDVWEYRVP
jgi:hypothetical protein